MALLDLPSPVLTAIDGWLVFLPPVARLVLWGGLGALLSMELYRLLSPQKRIAHIKQKLREVQVRLNDFDGPFEEAWIYIRRLLSLAVGRVLLVFPATLIASLPLLFLLVWADARFGESFPPPGETVSVSVPGDFQGRWIGRDDGAEPVAEVTDTAGNRIAEISFPAPASTVHKWTWWNLLIGNPAGYLPESAPFDRVEVALPRQQFISVGPGWLRGWEPVFLLSTFLFALALKYVRRIE